MLDLTAPDAVSIPQDGMMSGGVVDDSLDVGTDGLDLFQTADADGAARPTPPSTDGSAPTDPAADAKRWQDQYRDAQIQMRRAQAQHQRQLQELEQKAALPPDLQQLAHLMKYPGAKARLTEFLGQLSQDPNFDPGQPEDAVQDRGLRQEFETIKPLLQEFQELTEALRYERAETQVNQIHEELQQTYPDAFAASPDLFPEIARTVLERFGDDPTPDNIRYVAYEKILQAMPKATQRAAGQIARAMQGQPPGARLLTGAASTASAPPAPEKNYAKMSWREIEQDALNDLYGPTS